MKGGRYSLEVERYLVRTGPQGDELELDGWLSSDAPVEAARLAPPGAAPLAVSLHAQANDDDRRLLLHLRAPTAEVDPARLASAWLEIDAANGDRLEFAVGHLFRPLGWMPPVVAFATGIAHCLATIQAEPPDAEALADALRDEFAAMDDIKDLYLHPWRSRWAVTSHRYGIRFATTLDVETPRDEARRLAWTAARTAVKATLETLGAGAPLLVYRRRAVDTDRAALQLFAALRTRNPLAALLWVDPHRQTGPVRRLRADAQAAIEPGLLVGSADGDGEALLRAARDLLLSPL